MYTMMFPLMAARMLDHYQDRLAAATTEPEKEFLQSQICWYTLLYSTLIN